MPAESPILELSSFLGVQTKVNQFQQKSYELKRAENVRFDDPLFAISKDAGYAELADAGAATNVLGMGSRYAKAGTTTLLVHHGTDIYTESGGSLTTTSQTLTGSTKGEFAQILDEALFTNYTEAPRSYNGTDWSTSRIFTSAPKARYVITYDQSGVDSRIYLLNLDISGTAEPFTMEKSSSAIGGSISWVGADNRYTIPPGKYGGTGITGATVLGSYMIIFTDAAIYRFNGYSIKHVDTIGTLSNRSIQTINGKAYFANQTGIYSMLPESAPVRISYPIQEYWDGINFANASTFVSANINNTAYRLWVGDISNGDISLSDAFIELDLNTNAFRIGTFKAQPTCFHNHHKSGIIYTYMGDENGKVMTVNTLTTQDGGDFGSYWETPYYYPFASTRSGFMQTVTIEGQNLGASDFFYQVIDDKESSKKPLRFKGDHMVTADIDETARGIKFMASDNSSVSGAVIEKISLFGGGIQDTNVEDSNAN